MIQFKPNIQIFFIYAFLALVSPFLIQPLYSQEIHFKNGEIMDGTILDQDKDQIIFQDANGKTKTIQKIDIKKIVYKDSKINSSDQKYKDETEEWQKERAELFSKAITPLPLELDEGIENMLLSTPTKDTPNENFSPSQEGATIRSLFFPGWGQFYQGRIYAGYFYSSLAFLGMYAYYRQNQIYRNALRDYNRIINPAPSLLAESLLTGSNANLRQEFYGWLPLDPSMGVGYLVLQQEFSPAAQQKKALDRHLTNRDNIGYALLALWLFSSLDAYFFHPNFQLTILSHRDSINFRTIQINFSFIRYF